MRAIALIGLLRISAPTHAQDPKDPLAEGASFLLRHQSPDGSWFVTDYVARCKDTKCEAGSKEEYYCVGITGLTCLALLAAGHSIQDVREPGKALRKGIEWLLKQQDDKGVVGQLTAPKFMYGHAIATMVFAEALRSIPPKSIQTEDAIKRALAKAVAFLLDARNPGAAWRYMWRSNDNDVSVTGWVLQALAAAKLVNEKVPDEVVREALKWIASVTDAASNKVGYDTKASQKVYAQGRNEQFNDHPTMTAAAGLCRALNGDTAALAGIGLVLADSPKTDSNSVDSYYWYCATRYVRAIGTAEQVKGWSGTVTRAISGTQLKEGCARGSWAPVNR